MKLPSHRRMLQTYAQLVIATAALAAVPESHADGRFCANPKTAPALSFSIISFQPGEMGATCREQILRAKSMGFTQVAIVPTFLTREAGGKRIDVDRTAKEVVADVRKTPQELVGADASLNPGELNYCLEQAWSEGLDITFQPHIDNEQIVKRKSEVQWRAHLDIKPDEKYLHTLFSEFTAWTKKRESEIEKQGRKVDAIFAAELESSTQNYSSMWSNALSTFRKQIPRGVRVGFNPNWNPIDRDKRFDPNAYAKLVKEFDFISPSIYHPSTENTSLDDKQLNVAVQDTLKRLNQGGEKPWYSPTSAVRKVKRMIDSKNAISFDGKPISIGEIGVGATFYAPFEYARFQDVELLNRDFRLQNRRKYYQNVIASAKSPNLSPTLESINLWTNGVHDPVGITRHDDVFADPEIARLFQEYARWRCPGIQLPEAPLEHLKLENWAEARPFCSANMGEGSASALELGLDVRQIQAILERVPAN